MVKFRFRGSVVPWMALVPRIPRFTDFEGLIIAALACNFCSPAVECRDDLQSRTGLFYFVEASCQKLQVRFAMEHEIDEFN